MKASEPIDRARLILADTGVAPRFADADFFLWLSDGQREMYKRRPDLFLASSAVTAPSDVTAVTDDLAVDEDFRAALADYLVARALQVNADHADNLKRSNFHMGLFAAEIS